MGFNPERNSLPSRGGTTVSVPALPVTNGRRTAAEKRASMGTLRAADFSLSKMIEETLPVPMSVTTLGNCVGVGTDLFFPRASKKSKADFVAKNLEALKLCWWCPARRDCLGFALENGEEHGIWGGISAEERDDFLSTATEEAKASKETLKIEKVTDDLLIADTQWRRDNEYL